MIILVKRMYFRDTYTIGALQVDGKYQCDTLEPHAINWQEEKKVAGRTAIPEGCYKVELAYSPTFRKKMPYLMNVPHFTGVMIHTGNLPKNTKGCILVGRVAYSPSPAPPRGETIRMAHLPLGGDARRAERGCLLVDSRITFNKLYSLIEAAIERGEEVWVKVWSVRQWGV